MISHQWCAARLVGIAHHSFYSEHTQKPHHDAGVVINNDIHYSSFLSAGGLRQQEHTYTYSDQVMHSKILTYHNENSHSLVSMSSAL